MNPFLLYKDRDFAYKHHSHNQTVIQDLQLDFVFRAMARENDDLFQTARQLMLQSETDRETIMYRQEVLQDALKQPKFIQGLYAVTSEMMQEAQPYKDQIRLSFGGTLSIRSKLKSALDVLELIISKLIDLRRLGVHYKSQLQSAAFRSLFQRVEEQYSDLFIRQATEHINRLKRANEENRVTIDVHIGDGLKGTKAVLRELETTTSQTLLQRMLKTTTVTSSEFSFSEIQEAAFTNVHAILKRFIDRMLQFFEMLRFECGFYLGGVHLYETLQERGCELSFPEMMPIGERTLRFKQLVDVGLAVHSKQDLTANDLDAEGTRLVVITGANQGGKTTYLRSIGAAQLMMQCGLFVPAAYFQANGCDRIFTHFTKDEDKSMVSGRLDDELSRLDQIIDELTVNSLLIMNEPFLSTTEREGSAIAKDLLSVCYERKLKLLIVTHFYELANWCYESSFEHALFLSPERDAKGNRTYRLEFGKPQPTSYGMELFRRVIQSPQK